MRRISYIGPDVTLFGISTFSAICGCLERPSFGVWAVFSSPVPRFVMDSYFKFTKSPAVEGTKFFAWNMFISGGGGHGGDTRYSSLDVENPPKSALNGDSAPGVVILITNFVFPSLMTLGQGDPLVNGGWMDCSTCYSLIAIGGIHLSNNGLIIVLHRLFCWIDYRSYSHCLYIMLLAIILIYVIQFIHRFLPKGTTSVIDSEGMLIWMPGRTTHHFFHVLLTSRETMGCPIYQSLFVFI